MTNSIRIGNVEVLALLDVAAFYDPAIFFVGRGEEYARDYGHLVNERGLATLSFACHVVRTAGKTVLVDTGIGPRKRTGLPRGKLDLALKDAGIDPAEIDAVLNTHLHNDHVGWNTVEGEDGKPRAFFPNARFIVQQREWDFWMQPQFLDDPENAHLHECVLPLRDEGRLELFGEGETAFDEHLTFVAANGHTPGHVAVGISSGGERGIIVGDASHHPLQLDHPDWCANADIDPEEATKTRNRLFDEAAADERAWIAGHWDYPGLGRIIRLEGRRVFRAL